ncbi:MAG TPA: nuclear transport factor 2 family protein [Rhizobacter sp.]|nr:nuclear transport factor 2 family protein [Rhizobacter sp.]
MELTARITENLALYSQWVRMWNGELELSDDIIGEQFIVHQAADACQPRSEVRNAGTVRAWVDGIRSHNKSLAYSPQDRPSVSGSTVLAYWRARGQARASEASTDVEKVGVDVLRVANGKFVECWTANFDTAAPAD